MTESIPITPPCVGVGLWAALDVSLLHWKTSPQPAGDELYKHETYTVTHYQDHAKKSRCFHLIFIVIIYLELVIIY